MEHLEIENDGLHHLAIWRGEQIGYTDAGNRMLMHGLIDLEEDEDSFQGEEADELRVKWTDILDKLRSLGFEPYEDE